MTRRLQTCARCQGKTRHADRQCAACRRGRPVLMVVRDIANIHAPTVAELNAGIPIGHMVEGFSFSGGVVKVRPVRHLEPVVDVDDSVTLTSWHGTDCACSTCTRDRIPGRFA